MIFVNDLWTLTNIPGWLEHTPAEADDMGLADTVFPAFLFIVGMSIPLGITHRKQEGDSNKAIFIHIIQRSIALLVMGLFLVNGEYINEAATGMQREIWNIVCCTAFILLWNRWPKKMNRFFTISLKIIGIATLLTLVFIYRGGEASGVNRFSTYWWGILGLIGWAYLITALVYLFAGSNLLLPIVTWLLFLFLCCASHAGWIKMDWVRTLLSPFGDGAMPAFTMGGVVTTLIVVRYRQRDRFVTGALVLLVIAAILFLSGLYLRDYWGISKIRATPAWVLICSAITIGIFVPLWWLIDQRRKAGWFNIIRPAGTNTLLCYLLPYFAYGLAGLTGWYLPAVLLTGNVGLFKSFAFAMLIVLLAGLLGKWGLRLKL